MAGCSGNTKEGGSLDKERSRLCHRRQHNCRRSNLVLASVESSFSECYKKRRKLEQQRTYCRSLQALQRDIRRIFTQRLHSDFLVIHESDIVETNRCIVEARSPRLYEILRTRVVRNNDTIEFYVDSSELFRRIKDFSRLLYSNLDLRREEEELVKFIKTVNLTLECEQDRTTDHLINPEDRKCQNRDYKNFKIIDPELDNAVEVTEDLSPIVSTPEMADSGLETGSVSPQETTESENSVTDLEESHCTDYVSMDDDPIAMTLNGNSSDPQEKNPVRLAVSRTSPNDRSDIDPTKKTGKTRVTTSFATNDANDRAGCSSPKHDRLRHDRDLEKSLPISFDRAMSTKNREKIAETSDQTDRRRHDRDLEKFIPISSASDPTISKKNREKVIEPSDQSDRRLNDRDLEKFIPISSTSGPKIPKKNGEKCSSTSDESDCVITDIDDDANYFVATESFEYVEPDSSTIVDVPRRNFDLKTPNEKLSSLSEARGTTSNDLNHEFPRSNDLTLKLSSSSVNNYYFIDASSLNDESENAFSSLNSEKTEDSPIYVPTRTSRSSLTSTTLDDAQIKKLTSRKFTNPQQQPDGHERIAEFERELKMTEHLEPMKEQRRVRRVDSLSDEKSDAGTFDRAIEKETLVVEIKEADSGESEQPSPVSDDYCVEGRSKVKVVGEKMKKKLSMKESNDDEDDEVDDDDQNDEDDEDESQDCHQHQQRRRRRRQRHHHDQPPLQQQQQQQQQQPPTLIRRNTFELDPNDEKLSTLRQDYERRQGHLLFQNSIPQYSGHRVDDDSCFELPREQIVPQIPMVTEIVNKFTVDDPQTGLKYSSITYLTTAEKPSENSAITMTRKQDDRCTVNEATVDVKFPGTSVFRLGDTTKTAFSSSITKNLGNDEKTIDSTFSGVRSGNDVKMTSWNVDGGSRSTNVVGNTIDDNFTTKNEKISLFDDRSIVDEDLDNCCTSLPIDLNYGRCGKTTTKRLKRDETTPIVSGGSSTVDYVKPVDSPIVVRRKSESTPIVSGGSVVMNDERGNDHENANDDEDRRQIRGKSRMSSSMTSWIVDMSPSNKTNSSKSIANVDTQTQMSQSSYSYTDLENKKLLKNSTSSCEPKHNSLGFFVNLNDIVDQDERKPTKNDDASLKKSNNHDSTTTQKSCEFFVDMSTINGKISLKNLTEGRETNGLGCGSSSSNSSTSNGIIDVREKSNADKKNIFSMFIDLKDDNRDGKTKFLDKKFADDTRDKLTMNNSDEVATTTTTTKTKTIDETRVSDANEKIITTEKNKPSVFMFIESDSPIVRRRAMSSSRPSAFQRHSWNVDKSQSQLSNNHETSSSSSLSAKDSSSRRNHKRAQSVSIDRLDLRRMNNKSSCNSSHSLSEVARADTLTENCGISGNGRSMELESSGRNTDTSTEEILEYDAAHRCTPPNSHVEILSATNVDDGVEKNGSKVGNEGGNARGDDVGDDDRSDFSGWDKTTTESTEGHTRKSETFDISSGGSGPSPETDNHQDLDLDDIPIGKNMDYTKIMESSERGKTRSNKIFQTHKSLTETIMKIESELKKPDVENFVEIFGDVGTKILDDGKGLRGDKGVGKVNCGKDSGTTSFVRLSDLDKRPARENEEARGAKRDGDVSVDGKNRNAYRMSNSIPETSWVESKLAINRCNVPIKTIGGRKFTSVMSTSLPAKHKSPVDDGDNDGEAAGISESDLSSMQSSMCRSGADVSTEETETSSMGVSTKPYNRLGEDLLRMFLEEINPDVTIDVGGRRIRAHKCILSSRCQYFAAILSGGWIESTGNMISLQGYSYNSVHFALCYIYSGESNIPETLSIVELATLADMLCLEGLKEVIGYTVKLKYCHLFHKPCQVCAVGVVECMPLAAACGLDEVYRKSLRWITRHFVRIWPSKAFATLPRELMDKCYHQHIVHMSTDNVLQTMMDCDKLLATLPNVRWAEPVFRMVSNLLETAVKFISENFSGVLGNENFQALGRDLTWNISRLEDNFLAAADRLPPDQACKSYSKLNKMLASSQIDESQTKSGGLCWGPLFVDFLRKIHGRVEKCLVKEASRAARTTTWLKMDLELRRRIQELACLVILPHETPKRPSRRSNFLKEPKAPTVKTPANRNLDLRRVKMAISEHTEKITKPGTTIATNATTMSAPSTTQQVKKTVLVKPRSDPLERKVAHEEKPVASNSTSLRPKSWPNKLEVKSRYLEPRNKSVTKDNPQPSQPERVIVQQRRKIMISSSDSSRTSSPAMKRANEKKPLAKMKLPIKKDTIRAMSSDSLAETTTTTSRAMGTAKKETLSKSCGITRPESPSLKKTETTEICLSADSLVAVDTKNKQQQQQQHHHQQQQSPSIGKKKSTETIGKMDTSMSTDSLMAETSVTPKSTNLSNKVSPTMTRVATNKTQIYDRVKKSSPPVQQKNPSAIAGTRRLTRTLECSTAASRNRAAAISAYHGSPNLRRNLLEAAKTPDVGAAAARSVNTILSRTSPRQQSASTASPPRSTTSTIAIPSASTTNAAAAAAASLATSASGSVGKKDKKDGLSNQSSTESPGKKSSPKSNGHYRSNRITNVPKRFVKTTIDDKLKLKCQNGGETTTTTKNQQQQQQQPTVGSRSGTFLKDEPTILKKSDIKTVQISSS